MGALNIKDPAVAEKARRLAEATGKSITAAVSDALDQSLAVIGRRAILTEEERERRVADIQRRFKEKQGPNAPTYEQIMEDMYDEHGLPR